MTGARLSRLSKIAHKRRLRLPFRDQITVTRACLVPFVAHWDDRRGSSV
jgi:hypothetical protein